MGENLSKKNDIPPVQTRQRTSPTAEISSKTSGAIGTSHSSKFTAQQQKMTELEEIVDKLSELHESVYTVEQIRAWAHMLQMKKHASYEEPPNKPFFKRAKSNPANATSGMSPGKRIQYRSQCIDQLDKWHTLKERGVISAAEYSEMQSAILSDVKKFLISTQLNFSFQEDFS